MYLESISILKEYVENLTIESGEQLMLLVGEKSSLEVEELINYLNNKNIKFFGGIYPRLLIEKKSCSKGFIIEKFEPIYSAMVLPFLMRFKLDLSSIEGCTAFILVDGLSSRMKDLTNTVYEKLGPGVNYVGGGAGYYDMKQRPCIFDNRGIYKDVLYVCVVKNKSNVAVKHGWNKLEGPFEVAASRDNVLTKLDSYSAFEVYRDVIEDHEHIRLLKGDFFIYAKDHPFGILQSNGEVIVRDPIRVNENDEIICVADIPVNSQLYVLEGNPNTLLNSSIQIAEHCASIAPKKYVPFLFDCISRAMFLEERFDEEISNIQSKLAFKVKGALSIGEISSRNDGKLIIHNKSTILGLLEIE
ncbi:FIST signal transduction protein [Clostridium thailandense]|nr:FIST C-terminal domain-containing protein [Clostridium thailandense]